MTQENSMQLQQGDCIGWLRGLPAASAQMIYADPPYNLSGAGHQTLRSGRPVKCDKGEWDKIEDLESFNDSWIRACLRVLHPNGTIWISGTLHNHPSVGQALKRQGLWLINDIVWCKRNAPPLFTCNRFVPSTELIWLAAKSKAYYFDYAEAKRRNGGKQMRNYWEINAQRHVTPHPTEKPEILLERMVAIGSRPGDLVLDPFMGSGTTGVAAKRMGRRFAGCEINPEYFRIARDRLANVPNLVAAE